MSNLIVRKISNDKHSISLHICFVTKFVYKAETNMCEADPLIPKSSQICSVYSE